MDNRWCVYGCLLLAGLLVAGGCSRESETEVAAFPLNGIEGVVARSNVTFDEAESSDGYGSVRIEARGPMTVRLVELDTVDVEAAQLTYRARMRTAGLSGSAYLEMWCDFAGKGEYFSRDLATPLIGDNEWTTEETVFFLREGENPDRVRLNVGVTGEGTVWIDDIRLVRGPLE